MTDKAACPVPSDYGLGTFKGQPLVLCTSGGHFHRNNHRGRVQGVTFTEAYAASAGFWKRCRICWRST